MTVTTTRSQDEVLIQAQFLAGHLALAFGVPSVRYTKQLGNCWLVYAKRTKRGATTIYNSEAKILADHAA